MENANGSTLLGNVLVYILTIVESLFIKTEIDIMTKDK